MHGRIHSEEPCPPAAVEDDDDAGIRWPPLIAPWCQCPSPASKKAAAPGSDDDGDESQDEDVQQAPVPGTAKKAKKAKGAL